MSRRARKPHDPPPAPLNPRRAGLARAWAALLGVDEVAVEPDGVHYHGVVRVRLATRIAWRVLERTPPAETWERLASRGVIPLHWVGDPRRAFASRGGVSPHPPDHRACVALASDPAGVSTAEAIARELAAASRAPGLPAPRAVVWRVLGGGALDAMRRELAAERARLGAASLRAAPDLCALGYALERVTDEAITLVAPEA